MAINKVVMIGNKAINGHPTNINSKSVSSCEINENNLVIKMNNGARISFSYSDSVALNEDYTKLLSIGVNQING